MAIEIGDFPNKNGDVPWQNVSSPEGSINFNGMNIHLPAVLWFTRYQGSDSLPHLLGVDGLLSKQMIYPLVNIHSLRH